MINFRRITPTLTGALFTAALAVGATGWATGTAPLTDAGVIGLLAAVPLMYWVLITRTHELTDEQLNAAARQGYLKALDHVGQGLVDVPRPPSPGRCETCGRHGSPADVINLDEHRRSAPYATEENRAVP